MIRLLLFALAAWVAWKMFQNYKAKQTHLRQQRQQALQREHMVQCAYCRVHLPASSAVAHEELWFCDDGHRSRFLAR